MFEEITQKRSRWRTFWPEVDDLDGAKEAIRLGYWACLVLSALNGVVAILGPKAAFVDAALFIALGARDGAGTLPPTLELNS